MIYVVKKIITFFSRIKDQNFRKGISTLIGAGLINFFAGAIYSLCTLSVYEISYIKSKGGSINIENLSFYYPIEIIFQCISSIISGIIYKKLGLHITNLIGVTIISSGYLMMFISSSLFLDLTAMILGGIGTGIILYPSTTNSYKWFINHNGVIVGMMETMISFGSFFFAFIGEKIINNDEKESHEDDNLYDLEVAIKIKDYLIIQIISLVCAFILSIFLMFVKEDDKEETMSKIKQISNDKILGEEIKKKDEDKQKNENTQADSTESPDTKVDANIDTNKDNNDKNKNPLERKETENEKEKNEIKTEEIIPDYFGNNNSDGDLDDKNEIININNEIEKNEQDRKKLKKENKESNYKEENTISTRDDDEEDKKNEPLLPKDTIENNEEGKKKTNILAAFKFALKSISLILYCKPQFPIWHLLYIEKLEKLKG